MKNALLSLALVGLAAAPLQAQDGPVAFDAPSLHVSYGLFGVQALVETFSDVLTTAVTAGTVRSTDRSFGTGPISVAYLYPATPWLRVGAEYNYASFDATYTVDVGSGTTSTWSAMNTYHSLMVRTDALWVHANHLQVYSSAAIGGSLLVQSYDNGTSSESQVGPAFHVTALGVRAGGGLSVFAEVGFGFRGLLIGGVALAL